ncbi:hypothetical protein llap_16459 [Limosa lapponica baueri]|uniref:Uncharacterized protein n=1 Tax=Limosa lapponica baueri TaxID=1758121 RepID=A0A2I0THE8_LIMLA|nr:hypothetical protein llap_16459 [Limosa lapponica baueri]
MLTKSTTLFHGHVGSFKQIMPKVSHFHTSTDPSVGFSSGSAPAPQTWNPSIATSFTVTEETWLRSHPLPDGQLSRGAAHCLGHLRVLSLRQTVFGQRQATGKTCDGVNRHSSPISV